MTFELNIAEHLKNATAITPNTILVHHEAGLINGYTIHPLTMMMVDDGLALYDFCVAAANNNFQSFLKKAV